MEAKLEQTGWILEEDAAAALGVSRDVMREFRAGLEPDTGWRKKGRVVEIAQEAFLALQKKMGGEGAGDGAGEALGGVAASPGPVELVVKSVPKRNVRILVAEKKEGGGPEVRVRVRSNVNFMPGMAITARPEGGFADVFVLEGRCPRFRGRM